MTGSNFGPAPLAFLNGSALGGVVANPAGTSFTAPMPPLLRRHLPYRNGVPGGRWLTILMNRISPALFAAAFTAWVRATWPGQPDFVAIDGKISRRSHDRSAANEPIHLVSAFATTACLVLGQEAVPSKANELTAIPSNRGRFPGESVALKA